ncbi:DinB family protein [Nonlabens marinus]|nr:DinB family protein [Nonlabens marinus]
MDIRLAHNKCTRAHFVAILEELSTTDLNKIPVGFSNNIIWNIVHCMVTQQGLTYGLAGLEQHMSKGTILFYKHGTRPEKDVSSGEIEEFKNQLIPQLDQMTSDYQNDKFDNFKEYTTSTGYLLRNIDDAMNLVNIHDGIHLGYVLALRKALKDA